MEIKNITVIGSGAMGSGIAQLAITSGFQVCMNDLNMEILEKGRENITRQLNHNVEKGKLTEQERDAALEQLTLEPDLRKAGENADLVIEAAIEKEEVKKDIFRRLSEVCREDAVFASNTSSISITDLASVVSNPSRFIGTHFFNPAPVMKLLEIVVGLQTSKETVANVEAVADQLGKIHIIAKDRTGFIVNRLVDPFLNEAIYLVEEGIGTPEDIDKGAKYGLNHPMGPLELADMIGLDVLLAVMEVFYSEYGDPKYRPCPLLRRMVSAGYLGRKTGRGFYIYSAK